MAEIVTVNTSASAVLKGLHSSISGVHILFMLHCYMQRDFFKIVVSEHFDHGCINNKRYYSIESEQINACILLLLTLRKVYFCLVFLFWEVSYQALQRYFSQKSQFLTGHFCLCCTVRLNSTKPFINVNSWKNHPETFPKKNCLDLKTGVFTCIFVGKPV